jgi:hypothetical protein
MRIFAPFFSGNWRHWEISCIDLSSSRAVLHEGAARSYYPQKKCKGFPLQDFLAAKGLASLYGVCFIFHRGVRGSMVVGWVPLLAGEGRRKNHA